MATVKPDQSQWALPLDAYQQPPDILLAYASDLIRRDCLQKAGFDYPVIPYNENAPGSPTRNEVGRKLFDVSIAQKFGYHDAHSQRFSERKLQQRQEPSGDRYQDAANRCEKQVVAAGIDWSKLDQNEVAKIASSTRDKDGSPVSGDSAVKAAIKKWRACMEPLGLPQIPADPTHMPGAILANQFGLGKVQEWNSPPASAAEIRVAVADAKCRDSSGYSAAAYRAEYAAQQQLVKAHADELAPLLERNKRLLKAARKIIAERK